MSTLGSGYRVVEDRKHLIANPGHKSRKKPGGGHRRTMRGFQKLDEVIQTPTLSPLITPEAKPLPQGLTIQPIFRQTVLTSAILYRPGTAGDQHTTLCISKRIIRVRLPQSTPRGDRKHNPWHALQKGPSESAEQPPPGSEPHLFMLGCAYHRNRHFMYTVLTPTVIVELRHQG